MTLRPQEKTPRPRYPRQVSRTLFVSLFRRALAVAGSSTMLWLGGCGAAPLVVGSAPAEPAEPVAVVDRRDVPENEPSPPSVVEEESPENVVEQWVHLPVRILFPNDDAHLSDDAKAMLREARNALIQRTDIIRILVEGHAEPENDEAAEHRAGLERANAVIDFMVDELGFQRDRLEARSYGSERIRLSGVVASPTPLVHARVEFSVLVRRPVDDF